MAKQTPVIPKLDQYLDHSLNVLLIGLHGTGKTTAVLDLAKEKGYNVKLFTCSTLDVYVDLVGVPRTVTGPDGKETLEMVRPREVDKADFIFFDEINRAAPKTLNAILEIVQFGTINGEKLPNLKCCWAAMNPPEMDYQVETLDPALIDRFDVFEEVKARPSVAFMVSEGIRPEIAKALVKWWEGMDKNRREPTDYISPRRLVKMGLLYNAVGSCDKAIPGWTQVERAKLQDLLRDAEAAAKGQAAANAAGIGGAPNTAITYEKAYIKAHSTAIAATLRGAPDDLATHNAVIEALRTCHAPTLVRDYGKVLDAIRPNVLEAYVGSLADGKAERLATEVAALPQATRDALPNLTSVVEAEAANRTTP